MKYLISFCTLIIFTSFCKAQDNVLILGKVIDQNGKPISEVKVQLLEGDHYNTLTDSIGRFMFKNIPRDNSVIIRGGKENCLSKTEIYRYKTANDTVDITFTLRERATARIETSKISEADLGITIQEAIIKFKIDTTEASLQTEPPGVARGLEAELGDSTIIYLQIGRDENMSFDFNPILNKRIVGIGLAFTNCKTKQFGTGFLWYGLSNPYCKTKE